MNSRYFLWCLIFLQVACAAFFVFEIAANLFALRSKPISWYTRELIEVGAAFGLLLGVFLGGIALRRTQERSRAAEESLRVMRSAFADHLEERFATWHLTPAERDVALFSLKGLSFQEIAALRNTSEGTVKAQSNAIYRKASVTGRAQFVSLFIEDLMAGEAVDTTGIVSSIGSNSD